MPIYEYQCKACSHDFDVLQKVNEGALRKCPECGALKLQRLVSAPQFRLKGTGWYETDFKKDGKKRLVDTADSTAAADKDGTGKTDKPAADKDGASKADAAGKREAVEKKPVKAEKASTASAAAAD